MHFIYLHLSVLEQRFNFDNKSKNIANFHSIELNKSFSTRSYLELREYFTLETRVIGLPTEIEYTTNV